MKQIYREVGAVTKRVEGAVKTTSQVITPLQRSALRRFPTMFTLLVAFGVGATFLGIERILATIPWLDERPWFIFGVGVAVLIVTGRLHKKLD